jgi:hypothetical protein
MRKLAGRTGKLWAGITVLSLMAVSTAAWGSSSPPPRPAIPPEFQTACGHPGAHVTVRKVPVTISHAECDLTGVVISYRDHGGATVPRRGGGTGVGTSSGFRLTVQPGSLDVTVNATGVPGNA